MSRLLGLRYRLRTLLRRRAADRDTRDEMAYHMECAERAYLESGMSVNDAHRRAALEFGSAMAWRDATGDVRSGAHLENLWRDVRMAVRSFRARPGFVASVVITLGLGIGANTAIYSLIRTVLLDPVPVHEAERVKSVFYAASLTDPHERISIADYRDLAARVTLFENLAAVVPFESALEAQDGAEHLQLALVTGNYFLMLGVTPAAGRLLEPADDGALGASPVVVLNHDYWSRRFASDPTVVGRRVRIGTEHFTIVGVAPRGFFGTDLSKAPDAWLPITMNGALALGMFSSDGIHTTRSLPISYVTGRLKPGATDQQATAELNALMVGLRREHPLRDSNRQAMRDPISVLPIAKSAALKDRDDLMRFVRILLGTVLLTLALACVNVTNLFNLRGVERARELAVRAALGAGRSRIARQLLVENLLLALGAGLFALGIGFLTMQMLAGFMLPGGVSLERVSLRLDRPVLLFTLALACTTAIGLGVWPALRSARHDVFSVLRAGSDRVTGRTLSNALLGVQIAISLVLLVSATLFLRSIRAGLDTDLGFDPAPLVAIDVEPGLAGYKTDRSATVISEMAARAATLPGAITAAATTHVPLSPMLQLPLAEGSGTPDPTGQLRRNENAVLTGFASVTADYFETAGLKLIAGRALSSTDTKDRDRVLVVNESAARLFWPGRSALGRQLNLFGFTTYTVVGIVADTKYARLDDKAEPFVYAALVQESMGRATIMVRTTQPEATLNGLRAAVRQADAQVPVRGLRRVSQQVDRVLMPQRFGATLLSIFGLVALGISAIGLYGTVAYAASRRKAELGIRVAIGATQRSLVWLLMRHTLTSVAGGILIGIAAATAAARMLVHFLFGVGALDPASFMIPAIALGLGAIAIALLPACRGATVDPVRLLRDS